MKAIRSLGCLILAATLANTAPAGTPEQTWAAEDARYFPETGYAIRGVFLRYSESRGGLSQQGYPLTDEFVEVNPTTGQLLRVQYFERARFESHRSAAGGTFVPHGLLGREQVLAKYPQGRAPSRGITSPADNQRVTMPLHLFARVGEPGESVVATLRWDDGTEHAQRFTLLSGEDGRGLLIGSLDWTNFYDLDNPPPPPTQPATLTIRADDPGGRLLGAQRVTVLGPHDPDLQPIQVYWTISGTELVGPQPRHIVRTARVGAAALEELLWGPRAISQVGYRTALPAPEEVLAYPGRQPDWGPRVTLCSLEIVDGAATADFSRELLAYGGGALRVQLIGDQIRRTLLQFHAVREVRITIEGRPDLQP